MCYKNNKLTAFEDLVLTSSIVFLFFYFVYLYSQLRQSFFLPMNTMQISKGEIFQTGCWFLRRRQNVLHHGQMNRPRISDGFILEITRNPVVHNFYREHFRMSIDAFQALFRILPPFITKKKLYSWQRYREKSLWQLACGF